MENWTSDQLIKEATKIIGQDGHISDDIKKLSQIRYFLSIQYMKTNMSAGAREGLYNGTRADKAESLQKDLPVGKSGNMAKSLAEKEYGDYREIKAESQGISKILDAIEGFIINEQATKKAMNSTQY